MKKMNCFISVGLIFNLIFLLLNRFGGTDFLSEFIKGICAGLGIGLILFGSFVGSKAIERIRKSKKKLFSKVLGN